jgi:uncharacterized repeat protein (TIGR03837 family)
MTAPHSLHLYCRIVDNYGDAGVAWRLARQLATEHHLAVSLWIDRPEVLARLVPGLQLAGTPASRAGDLAVLAWPGATVPARVLLAADVVVCAFACEPPASLRAGLAGAPSRPLWIDLDYLSAEPWVDGCHALPSLKPRDGARSWFFCPGFTPSTGGLPRERNLLATRDGFRGAQAAAWWQARGLPGEPGLRLSVFCYPQAPLAALLLALAEGGEPTVAIVPGDVGSAQIDAFLARSKAHRLPDDGVPSWRAGALTLARPPWLPVDDYDRLLWSCDLNMVRGEDSWMRALWAGRPLLWQAYRQADDAHRAKREAFLAWQRATIDASPRDLAALEAMARAWCEGGAVGSAWPGLIAALPRLDAAFDRLSRQAAATDDLASRLVEFCRSRL